MPFHSRPNSSRFHTLSASCESRSRKPQCRRIHPYQSPSCLSQDSARLHHSDSALEYTRLMWWRKILLCIRRS